MITARELPFPAEGKSFVVEFEPATDKREANVFTVILKMVASRRLSDLSSFFSGVCMLFFTAYFMYVVCASQQSNLPGVILYYTSVMYR